MLEHCENKIEKNDRKEKNRSPNTEIRNCSLSWLSINRHFNKCMLLKKKNDRYFLQRKKSYINEDV